MIAGDGIRAVELFADDQHGVAAGVDAANYLAALNVHSGAFATAAALIDEVYARYGRIDGVIHGAGVIEDKLVGDKTLESFERVLRPKIAGALTLARSLRPESLGFLAFFSSVSARNGNLFDSLDAKEEIIAYLPHESHSIDLLPDRRYICNPGSVGQPRDRRPRQDRTRRDALVDGRVQRQVGEVGRERRGVSSRT